MANHYSSELLKGDNMFMCEKCDSRQVVKKQLLIHTAPDTMVIHLKRLLPTRKIQIEVPFLMEVDISKFLNSSGCTHSVAGIIMQLHGVVVHKGSHIAGH